MDCSSGRNNRQVQFMSDKNYYDILQISRGAPEETST